MGMKTSEDTSKENESEKQSGNIHQKFFDIPYRILFFCSQWLQEVMNMKEGEKLTSKKSNVVRLKKRWVFPAVYLACAALILTGVFLFQNRSTEQVKEDLSYEVTKPVEDKGVVETPKEDVPVVSQVENVKMPVLDPNMVTIQRQYYDFNASKEEQEASLVSYESTYGPNKGIDIVQAGKSFDVISSLSGVVHAVRQDPLLGSVVEIEHEDGVVTVYQSLANTKVEQGESVKQGQVIGVAGQNEMNKEAGIHAHFEIRKDGVAVNPIDFFNQPVTSLTAVNTKSEEKKKPATQSNNQTKGPDASLGMLYG